MQAQQEVMQAQTDLDTLMQEAPLPVMPVPQVNRSLVKTLEALTGTIENMWNPDARPLPDSLVHAIQESRAILQTPSVILSQEGRRAGSRSLDEDEAEEMGGLRRGAPAERTPMTPPLKKTRTAACQHEQCRTPETRNSWPSRSEHARLSGPWQFLKLCSAHPGRHWPTCFDQTCGYPGEGPLTTLDSPDAPAISLTATQEIKTCDMVRRKTKWKRLWTCIVDV